MSKNVEWFKKEIIYTRRLDAFILWVKKSGLTLTELEECASYCWWYTGFPLPMATALFINGVLAVLEKMIEDAKVELMKKYVAADRIQLWPFPVSYGLAYIRPQEEDCVDALAKPEEANANCLWTQCFEEFLREHWLTEKMRIPADDVLLVRKAITYISENIEDNTTGFGYLSLAGKVVETIGFVKDSNVVAMAYDILRQVDRKKHWLSLEKDPCVPMGKEDNKFFIKGALKSIFDELIKNRKDGKSGLFIIDDPLCKEELMEEAKCLWKTCFNEVVSQFTVQMNHPVKDILRVKEAIEYISDNIGRKDGYGFGYLARTIESMPLREFLENKVFLAYRILKKTQQLWEAYIENSIKPHIKLAIADAFREIKAERNKNDNQPTGTMVTYMRGKNRLYKLVDGNWACQDDIFKPGDRVCFIGNKKMACPYTDNPEQAKQFNNNFYLGIVEDWHVEGHGHQSCKLKKAMYVIDSKVINQLTDGCTPDIGMISGSEDFTAKAFLPVKAGCDYNKDSGILTIEGKILLSTINEKHFPKLNEVLSVYSEELNRYDNEGDDSDDEDEDDT